MNKETQTDKGYDVKEKEGGVIEFAFTKGSEGFDHSTERAKQAQAEVNDLLSVYDKNEALMLVELSNDDGVVSTDANAIYKETMKDDRIMRMAIYGGIDKYRSLAKTLLPITSRGIVKVFDTKHDAMHWLLHS